MAHPWPGGISTRWTTNEISWSHHNPSNPNRPAEPGRTVLPTREGAFFGELALLGDHVRTATVTALTPSALLRLTRREVVALASKNPEVRRRLDDVRRIRSGAETNLPC